MNRDYDFEVGKFFGDRFTSNGTKSRFEVMLEHYERKYEITNQQARDAYEKTYTLYQEGKCEKFAGYFAALCKSKSEKEYTPEQTQRYIFYHVKERKTNQLEDFIKKYESGVRRVFAPRFGITKKEHNDIAYEMAKAELSSSLKQHGPSPEKELAKTM